MRNGVDDLGLLPIVRESQRPGKCTRASIPKKHGYSERVNRAWAQTGGSATFCASSYHLLDRFRPDSELPKTRHGSARHAVRIRSILESRGPAPFDSGLAQD